MWPPQPSHLAASAQQAYHAHSTAYPQSTAAYTQPSTAYTQSTAAYTPSTTAQRDPRAWQRTSLPARPQALASAHVHHASTPLTHRTPHLRSSLDPGKSGLSGARDPAADASMRLLSKLRSSAGHALLAQHAAAAVPAPSDDTTPCLQEPPTVHAYRTSPLFGAASHAPASQGPAPSACTSTAVHTAYTPQEKAHSATLSTAQRGGGAGTLPSQLDPCSSSLTSSMPPYCHLDGTSQSSARGACASGGTGIDCAANGSGGIGIDRAAKAEAGAWARRLPARRGDDYGSTGVWAPAGASPARGFQGDRGPRTFSGDCGGCEGARFAQEVSLHACGARRDGDVTGQLVSLVGVSSIAVGVASVADQVGSTRGGDVCHSAGGDKYEDQLLELRERAEWRMVGACCVT